MPDLPSQAPSWRYTSIYEDHYAEKADKQRKFLTEVAYQFLEPQAFLETRGLWEKVKAKLSQSNLHNYFPEGSGIEAVVSPFHIERLSRAYFIDIIRYKEYHYNPKDEGVPYDEYVAKIHSGDDKRRLGPDKIAAFLVKWILRSQPIQVEISRNANLKDPRLNDLIWYVNIYFALFVAAEKLQVPLKSLDRKQRLDLLHHFRFRTFDESAFILLFKSIQERNT